MGKAGFAAAVPYAFKATQISHNGQRITKQNKNNKNMNIVHKDFF